MNESSSPAPAPVSPLWTRDFTIITLGSVISMLGNSMSGFALSLLVLDYTGSNLLYAIYIATFTLPQIVMPIFSGAILDRFSRKKTIYTLDFLSSGGLPCRCADPEPRLVQLSDARGLLLYHRLDQQHLLCRL